MPGLLEILALALAGYCLCLLDRWLDKRSAEKFIKKMRRLHGTGDE